METIIQYSGDTRCRARNAKEKLTAGDDIPLDAKWAPFEPVNGDQNETHYSIDESGNLMYAPDSKQEPKMVPQTKMVFDELVKIAADENVSNDNFITLLRLRYKADVTQADIHKCRTAQIAT